MNERDVSEVALPPSLIDGVEQAACSTLNIARLRHRSALHSLRLSADIDLVDVVYRTIAGNWAVGRAVENKDRSRQNWRWALQPKIGAANRSPEVVLERAIASACVMEGRTDWANQVPVASGLVAGSSDGRRAIDLVKRRGEGDYELIELKIASDTPLYAAVELLGYASLWLLARSDPPAHGPELLKADRIRLRVLAPAAYYAPFDVVDLERSIDRGARLLGHGQDVDLTFGFDILPESLARSPLPDGSALLETMTMRMPLHGND